MGENQLPKIQGWDRDLGEIIIIKKKQTTKTKPEMLGGSPLILGYISYYAIFL